MATTLVETFPGSVGVGTNDPGSYRFNLTGGTSSFQALEVTNLKVGSSVNAFIPVGGIVLWSGTVASIPTGWVLCDGTNSTPDLRDRFIIGAGSTYAVDGTGGTNTTSIAVTNMPGHTHTGTTAQSGQHNHTCNTSQDDIHSHQASSVASGNHGHGFTMQQGGEHSHPGATQAAGWHGHQTHIPSWGNGQWNNLTGGWRNAFTGWFGHKTGWDPQWGANGSGNHNHTIGSNGVTSNHGHGYSVVSTGAHTHTVNTGSSGGHTHTATISQSSNHAHNYTTQNTGQGQVFSIIPSYYALAYIMKT